LPSGGQARFTEGETAFSITLMLQTGEIIIIAVLALIVLGPTRLPEMARKVGGWLAELRRAAREITAGLEAEVAEFKEVGQELKRPMDEVKKPFTEIRDDVKGLGGAYEWKGPKPVSGPTPEDAMRDLERMQAEQEEEPPPPDAEQTE
jgi:sec-independent protein translocase protein TatB